MRILFIADVFGKPGRRALADILPHLRQARQVDLVVANGENAAGGSGLTERVAGNLFEAGVDVITTGNHVWDKPEVEGLLLTDKRVVRPANENNGRPGRGYTLVLDRAGREVGVLNLLGRVFMKPVDCPFQTAQRLVEEIARRTPIILVDFHAEATSEKRALGFFLAGRVSAVLGTHTHIQTADEEILPGGTAYQTDVGMTGPHDSVIGLDKEQIIRRFQTGQMERFLVAAGGVQVQSVLVEIEEKTGRATAIERINVHIGELG